MPRKAKEEMVETKSAVNKIDNSKKSASLQVGTSNKVQSKKPSVEKKTTSKNSSINSDSTKKASSKTQATKATTKKRNTSKSSTHVAEKKLENSKKKVATKSTPKTAKKTSKKVTTSMEYYDLPAFYNKTIVKLLAQTPFCLFVYWEVSENDKKNFEKQYGTSFFQDTKPYLIVTNQTKDYIFEIEISDYANSWYIPISDSDCKYKIELVRKPISVNTTILQSQVYISSSNEISSPNDHILFDKLGKTIFFRNTKTNFTQAKEVTSISFLSNLGKIYNIYDLYKEIYQNELDGDALGTNLSSSQFSSTFK